MALSSVELVELGVDQWFADAVSDLVRGGPEDLDPFIVSVGNATVLDGTAASCTVHFLQRDGNRRPLLQPFASWLARQVTAFCIPRSRIEEAGRAFERTRSPEQFAQLNKEARELFTSLDNSGESGELLLAVLLERLLGCPQVLCKMSLKTSQQMHVHGADGVHIKALDGEQLAIYWGESKLHAKVSSAIGSAFESIGPYLKDTGGGQAQRDLFLVRGNLDTANPDLDEFLGDYFTGQSIKSTKRVFRGAALVGFSLDEYPEPHDAAGAVAEEVATAIKSWHDMVGRRVADQELTTFDINVFCLPMPSVEAFRAAVKAEL